MSSHDDKNEEASGVSSRPSIRVYQEVKRSRSNNEHERFCTFGDRCLHFDNKANGTSPHSKAGSGDGGDGFGREEAISKEESGAREGNLWQTPKGDRFSVEGGVGKKKGTRWRRKRWRADAEVNFEELKLKIESEMGRKMNSSDLALFTLLFYSPRHNIMNLNDGKVMEVSIWDLVNILK